ncbi:MAG: hypothetical protein AB1772_04165 [Candidatus Zixiibacteriota bacterium]
MASSASADDFRLLLVRSGSVDRATGLVSGELIIGAGYINGIDSGMSGVAWRKNKYKGQLEVADIMVVEVSPYDAVCRYTLRHPDLPVQSKDKASLTPATRQDAEILAKGIEALDNRLCFDALLFFERIFCPNLENRFVQSQISQCLDHVQKKLAGGLSDDEKRLLRSRLRDDCELAEGHHRAKNALAADMYLKRILAVDTALARAAALRDSVPDQDYVSLFSPTRCK